jgi:hypothetical protein
VLNNKLCSLTTLCHPEYRAVGDAKDLPTNPCHPEYRAVGDAKDLRFIIGIPPINKPVLAGMK